MVLRLFSSLRHRCDSCFIFPFHRIGYFFQCQWYLPKHSRLKHLWLRSCYKLNGIFDIHFIRIMPFFIGICTWQIITSYPRLIVYGAAFRWYLRTSKIQGIEYCTKYIDAVQCCQSDQKKLTIITLIDENLYQPFVLLICYKIQFYFALPNHKILEKQLLQLPHFFLFCFLTVNLISVGQS